MSRFRFELATPADDADLRDVLAQTPMQGRIAVTFRRDPSFFAAAVVDGQQCQVVACRDLESGRIVGFGCRSIRHCFVDGQPQTVGYLSNLRLLEQYRNRGLVARGYAYFRRLHEDQKTRFYLTTIADGNVPAMKALTAARAGLPRYVPAGLFQTLAIPFTRGSPPNSGDGLTVRKATRDDLPILMQFLAEEGRRQVFFPVVSESALFASNGPWRGLKLEDLWLAWRHGAVVGVLGSWDQHSFKQTVVEGYSGALGWVRPALNAWWRMCNRPQLPAPGSAFRYRVAALRLVQNDDREILDQLLSHIVHGYAGDASSHFLVGMHERDPLLPVVRRRSVACYSTHLYLVSWDDEASALTASHGHPNLELGTL